jgi:ATP-binding cassette, subfamily B (MDR/TAP), member 1
MADLVAACIVLGQVAPLLPLFGSASAAFLRLRGDIDHRSAIDATAPTGGDVPENISTTIELRNVSFSYPSRPDEQVLKNVTIVCPAGKHTAIIGLSGSGKSTIAGLVARMYDPTGGEVLLGGLNIRSLNVKNLRSCIGLVQQEPLLFNRSILENIALGLVNSSKAREEDLETALLSSSLSHLAAEVREGKNLDLAAIAYGPAVVKIVNLAREAVVLADVATFIDGLEHGFGTAVGNGGSLVSGGQRQRLAFARALIRDPKVLVLDEATSSLDSASEQRIQLAIEKIATSRTLISIAHRLSTIKNADNIIVLSQGEVVEQGAHLELLASEGEYARLVRLQNIQSHDQDPRASASSSRKHSTDVTMSEKSGSCDEDSTKNHSDSKAAPAPDSKELIPVVLDDSSKDHSLNSGQTTVTVASKLGRLVRPNLGWFVLAVIAAVIVGGTYSAAGLVFGHTVGNATPCTSPDRILSIGMLFGGMFFMLAVVEFFANFISWSGFGYVAEKLLYQLRILSFRSLLRQGLTWHQSEGRSPTTLLSTITNDSAAVGGFSGSIMGTILSVVVNMLAAIILSHIIAWKIAIVCLVTVPILLGAGILQVRALSRFEERHAAAFSEAVGITVEAVNSMKTIAALSLEEEVLGTYRQALKAPQKEMIATSAYANVWLAVANSTGNIIYAFAYWWGAKLIIEEGYSPTQFFTILVAMLVSAQLWGQMFTLAPELSRARAAGSRILSLIDLGSSDQDVKRGYRSEPPLRGEKDIEATADALSTTQSHKTGVKITFSGVSFSYPARPHIGILQDMSFTIQPGQFCGLVGQSGAGKSTVMALVQRMYSPSSGTIEIDGVNIAHKHGADFRNDIAVVPQDSALFDGSVKFNVGLGARPGQEASDEEIEEACRLANIHETIITLPNGYDTDCGPNGSQLSGGQRQRLAIARALVRKPRLLLLDESTSALDAESEQALQEGLERAAKGVTVIAITHRLHTVRRADVILLLEGGRVADWGRHDELMEKNDSYRLNATQQMLQL